ncbi:MAG: acylphosphatase [Oscillospiraceae bacterium]|nr:acylphosphatase [Oscillospiraceae bacterium]
MGAEAERPVIRRHVVLRGWVQGVGLRYRARWAAAACGCTGWVRNEYDGSVTMELQGTERQIDEVILAVERGAYVRIEDMDSRSIPVVRGETGFHTR